MVLAGGYVEAGDSGRWRAEPGSVIVHAPYEAHRDMFVTTTQVLNLPAIPDLAPGAGSIGDPDSVARLAERDSFAAQQMLAALYRPGVATLGDWPDRLAWALARDEVPRLRAWADAMALDPASVSRGFARAYGVSPKRYRLEARTRRAWRAVTTSDEPLAAIAVASGFADQAHMTRALVALTGFTPGAWRAKSVQAGAGHPA